MGATDISGKTDSAVGEKLKAAVIIPAHDYPERLDRLLKALAEQTAEFPWRTVVVDDGSALPLKEIADKHAGVHYLYQKQSGPSLARNRGAAVLDAEILVFIDQDCLPDPEWLDIMLRPFDDPEVIGAKGVFTTRQKAPVARFVQAEYEEKYHHLQKKNRINFIDSYSAAFRSRDFKDCGGFDSSFPLPSVEDRELSLRLSNGQARFVFLGGARVEHLHTDSFSGYFKKKFKYGYWGFQVARQFPKLFIRDDHTPNSQRLQTAFVPLLPPLALAAVLGVHWPLWIGLAAFGLSALPLTVRAFGQGLTTGLASPLLIVFRATAVFCGLCAGALGGGLSQDHSAAAKAKNRDRGASLPLSPGD
jgi:glycosyltransferase involved in cell wall biosynthesis